MAVVNPAVTVHHHDAIIDNIKESHHLPEQAQQLRVHALVEPDQIVVRHRTGDTGWGRGEHCGENPLVADKRRLVRRAIIGHRGDQRQVAVRSEVLTGKRCDSRRIEAPR